MRLNITPHTHAPAQMAESYTLPSSPPLSGTYRVLATGQDVALHPSSALARAGGARSGVPAVDAVVFGELVRTTRTYARDVTAIDINWLPQLVPAFFARAAAAGG